MYALGHIGASAALAADADAAVKLAVAAFIAVVALILALEFILALIGKPNLLRNLSLRFGGAEAKLTFSTEKTTVQAATINLERQVDSLMMDAAVLKDDLVSRGETISSQVTIQAASSLRDHRVLWVDDNPDDRLYELERLAERGAHIATAASNREALEQIESHSFDAVVTLLARSEYGRRDPGAGLDLIEAVRNRGLRERTGPIFVYSTSDPVSSVGGGAVVGPNTVGKAIAAGAKAVTSATTELFELLLSGSVGEAIKMEQQVLKVLGDYEAHVEVKRHSGTTYYVGKVAGIQFALQVRLWEREPPEELVNKAVKNLTAFCEDAKRERWLITGRSDVADDCDGVRDLTTEGLRK
jgi:CheY-like chemotaxis protein